MRRKPTALKILQGNPGKKPLNRNEPKPRLAKRQPPPPSFLTGVAAKYWKDATGELLAIGLLSPLDYGALSMMCIAFAQSVDSYGSLKKLGNLDPLGRGLVLNAQNGNTVVNPLVGINQRAIGLFLRIATEFGMTPSARSRIEAHNLTGTARAPEEDEDDDISEFLKRA